jgi:hypothetical protein
VYDTPASVTPVVTFSYHTPPPKGGGGGRGKQPIVFVGLVFDVGIVGIVFPGCGHDIFSFQGDCHLSPRAFPPHYTNYALISASVFLPTTMLDKGIMYGSTIQKSATKRDKCSMRYILYSTFPYWYLEHQLPHCPWLNVKTYNVQLSMRSSSKWE